MQRSSEAVVGVMLGLLTVFPCFFCSGLWREGGLEDGKKPLELFYISSTF